MRTLAALLCFTIALARSPVTASGDDPRDTTGGAVPLDVLLIVIDDIGVEKIGAYGESPPGIVPPCTPNIDALAAEGRLFRNAWGAPVCSPMRAMVLTGRYSFRTGIGRVVGFLGGQAGLSAANETTLPEVLPGYTSAAVGKWHLANPYEDGLQHPLDCGFDAFAGSFFNLGVASVYCGPDCVPPDCNLGEPLGYYRWVKTRDVSGTGFLEQTCTTTYATIDTADEAIAHARALRSPWFLQVAFNSAHSPVELPPLELCPEDALCAQYCRVSSGTVAEVTNAMIEALDAEIGRTIAAIRRFSPNLMIILIGDNGSPGYAAQGPPGGCFDPERSKGTLFEGGLRVPLIAAGPPFIGGECDALVSAVDLFATIAELAGTPHPTPDSVSLVPYLLGDDRPLRETVYAEYFSPNFLTPDAPGSPPFDPDYHASAIRNARYKLIRAPDEHGILDEAFFDLALDPCESADLCPGPGPCVDAALGADQAANLFLLRAELARLLEGVLPLDPEPVIPFSSDLFED